MKKLALGALFAGLMAACGGGGKPPVVIIDSPTNDDSMPPLACNPLTQTGCNPGEKCTWITDQVMPQEVGHIGCAPDGTVALGGACTDGPPGPQGFDNCVKSTICVNAECKQICDPQAAPAASGCDPQHACNRYSGLFESGGMTVAGACDPACDPLTQALLAGSGNLTACGSTNPASPNKGCYTGDFEVFSCAGVPSNPDVKLNTDRVAPLTNAAGQAFINGCAPGYVPFFFEMTGSMKVLCTGLCAPGDISSANATEVGNAQGTQAPAKLVTTVAPVAGDGRCIAGKKGSASGGVQNCVFLWTFLTDAMGNPGPSQYNETVGVCFSFGQFMYDSNNDMMPDKLFPNCKDKPKRSAATTLIDDDAADFGCQTIVESAFTAGSQTAPLMKNFRMEYGPGEAVMHTIR
jgi:hypothetical protein